MSFRTAFREWLYNPSLTKFDFKYETKRHFGRLRFCYMLYIIPVTYVSLYYIIECRLCLHLYSYIVFDL